MMNVSYFAALFARADEGWMGTEAELAEVETAEDVTDLMREAAVETSGDPVLLLLEEDDEWFSVLRMDGEEDPRAFLSDARACSTSRLARLVGGYTGVVSDDSPDPAGDATLLEDLGVAPGSMLRLSDGMAAGDALLEVAENVGFAAEYDRLRA
jgi:putative tRNA adenosine deaminase-associated protein